MTEQMKNELEYALSERRDFIAEKDGKWCSGEWDMLDYAESKGWKFIGSVVDIAKANGINW